MATAKGGPGGVPGDLWLLRLHRRCAAAAVSIGSRLLPLLGLLTEYVAIPGARRISGQGHGDVGTDLDGGPAYGQDADGRHRQLLSYPNG